MRTILILSVIAGALAGCQRTPPPPATEVVISPAARLPVDPGDPAWQGAQEFAAKLVPQDLVEPRLMKPSTAEVRVRALHDATDVAFRLEWADATKNDTPGPGMFSDGCAVQMPAKADTTVPAPQMGEPGRPVEIVFWNAGWQAIVDGRADSIKSLYPNAQIDHYPFEAASLRKGSDAQKEMAARYAPARALGHDRGGPRTAPVEDYVAEGPGTISPNKGASSKGAGKHNGHGWAVVIQRRLPPGPRAYVAFAVWEGEGQEVGARKMRTGWVPATIRVKP